MRGAKSDRTRSSRSRRSSGSRKRFARSWTVWTPRSSPSGRSTSTRYDRHRDKLREELTLAQMDRHSSELEEMDLEGILAFAERVLPSASNLRVHSSLAQKQRLQQVFFSGWSPLRREEACWNRHNPAGFQLLESDFGREKRIGGPDQRQLEPSDELVEAARCVPSRFVESANHLLAVRALAVDGQPESGCEYHTPHDGWSEVRGAQVADGWVNTNRGPKSDDSGDR
jgi:hypothetical protein